MKKILLLFLLISFNSFAQDETKYLEGKVPEVDGKVVFDKSYSLPGTSQDQIYDLALEWAKKRFSKDNNRVVFTDKEKGDIAALGEDYVVFSSTAISLDRAKMTFRVIIHCSDKQLNIKATGIRYEYHVSYKREPELYIAEEWITDKAAISKGKLIKGNGKFRIGTIDYMNALFADLAQALSHQEPLQTNTNNEVVITKTAVPVIVAQNQPSQGALAGFKSITAESIPGNIIKMLSEDWMLITAGNETEFNMMTASWGGLGHMFSKPVAFCFINPTRHTYSLMEKYETYTLSFYTQAYRSALEYCGNNSGRDKNKVKESGLTPITTPSGSKAFNEAWMIIECRKLISQPLNQESISNEEIRNVWDGKQLHKMFVGEIINVWVK